jgi:hypothetical protein
MKKFLAFLLIVAMATVAFASCNSDKTIVVGYTVYEPMNFTDDEGNLTAQASVTGSRQEVAQK